MTSNCRGKEASAYREMKCSQINHHYGPNGGRADELHCATHCCLEGSCFSGHPNLSCFPSETKTKDTPALPEDLT